ncbi:MAG: 7-carboxy-7-deazaguanine synthase [Candidatus Nitrosopelagicus brevis]|jgi:7-carboxy-7-deazaguanine synthase|nr:7-carboxy-7-deazaguanine synthase QueE [Candidatus Nitrosopelagicus sp.]MEC8529604.1 7-carboxy-7-deazaguanine synthase QueE [Thermoproteota archaeon]NMI83844.1 7-carboxy-7-deazaguanine synthase QueE [Candidatus Nitrosopelagicus brevis]MEC9435891.1 7-carboxy-7-deazaguanine synthase QueE [Thermoproteota archaeon]MED5543188.1 7-carboxy-7-deazaguanine synthase QueE [Thermoproteota archaeon]|tara:strand:- start:270 stop:950 length:681 start_codon:yes stop_codon:yes gene_type:complete
MQVNEIFKSIQGEGPNFGKPAIFLRTAQCNLKCTWCDTKYTWDWKNYDFQKEVKEMTIDEVKDAILDLEIKHLVITGGEPLLQQDDLADLLSFLKPDFYVEVETNCTILPNKMLTDLIDQWNVSPKTKNSGNPLELCENNECYYFFANQENCFFKYVVENESDIPEIKKFVTKYNIPENRVQLMTQASTKEEISMKEKSISELAKLHNFSFSPRLHVAMWGSQRGK